MLKVQKFEIIITVSFSRVLDGSIYFQKPLNSRLFFSFTLQTVKFILHNPFSIVFFSVPKHVRESVVVAARNITPITK